MTELFVNETGTLCIHFNVLKNIYRKLHFDSKAVLNIKMTT